MARNRVLLRKLIVGQVFVSISVPEPTNKIQILTLWLTY